MVDNVPLCPCSARGGELFYFRVADRLNIIDKPNLRSSHTRITLRGGGIIFLVGAWLYAAFFGLHYPWFMAGLTAICAVSFADDVHSFMDGINGITGAYSLAVLIPLAVLNHRYGFVDPSLLYVTGLSVLVFCFFNFRKRARCFAGDVGSVGIAFIILYALGRLITATGDLQYLLLLGVYGVDTVLTIMHRILLHEHLGEAHRKHAYQLMANDLHIPHTAVSSLYFALQLAVSAGLIAVPEALQWPYTAAVLLLLALAYLLFMKKYYHLHAEYLNSLKS